MAPPLWAHADIACGLMEAGKHVLCEKMMAWDAAGCSACRSRAHKTGKLLEIGYQRFYNPVYQAAHEGIVKAGAPRRRLPRAAGLAPQRQLAAQGRAADAGLRPVALGLSRPSTTS